MNFVGFGSWGKVLGAILGFLLARGYGMVVGFVLGHLWDKRALLSRLAPDSDRFESTLFSLLGYLAKVDGHVSADEVSAGEAFLDKLELSGERRAEAVESFNRGRATDFVIQDELQKLLARTSLRSELCERILQAAVAFAHASGPVNPPEADALKTISVTLGFRADELERIQREVVPKAIPISEEEQALATLGLQTGATSDDIVRSYRKLMSSVHPDKLQGSGIRGDALKGAEGKAKAIRAAYELLCSLRGIK